MTPYRVASWHFHWRFWQPKQCIGGPLWFGWWAVCELHDLEDEPHRSEQTAKQVAIKRQDGLIQ
jgi:hypothetical protein